MRGRGQEWHGLAAPTVFTNGPTGPIYGLPHLLLTPGSMRTHQKLGLKGLEATAEGMLEEAAGRGGVEQALHEAHTGCGIAGA